MFDQHGICADRLQFENASEHEQLLQSYSKIDIALDPFPLAGGTTTAEALWMGLPVVNLAKDPNALQRLRISMRENLRHSALCDGPAYTKAVQATLLNIWKQYGAG